MTPSSSHVIEARLKEHLNSASKAIVECSNVCDAYQKKSLLYKVIQAPFWDVKLVNFVIIFSGLKKDIQFALNARAADTVDQINSTTIAIQYQVNDMSSKCVFTYFFSLMRT
jgi:hypothetical protein